MPRKCAPFCVLSAILAGSVTFAGGTTKNGIDAQRRLAIHAVEEICPEADLNGFQAQMVLEGSWFIDETRIPDDQAHRAACLAGSPISRKTPHRWHAGISRPLHPGLDKEAFQAAQSRG